MHDMRAAIYMAAVQPSLTDTSDEARASERE